MLFRLVMVSPNEMSETQLKLMKDVEMMRDALLGSKRSGSIETAGGNVVSLESLFHETDRTHQIFETQAITVTFMCHWQP